MVDKNDMLIEGVIADDVTYKTAETGSKYCTFSIHTETREGSKIVPANTRVFVFDQRCIDYLKRMNAHEGQRVSVSAYARTGKQDIHGKAIITTMVTVKDIHLIKMS